MAKQKVNKDILRSVVRTKKKYPYFDGYINKIISKGIVESDDIPTMAVAENSQIKYNPTFLTRLNLAAQQTYNQKRQGYYYGRGINCNNITSATNAYEGFLDGILIHEIMHVVLKHHSRFSRIADLDVELAQIAADMEVNDLLQDMGVMLPEGCMTPETFRFPRKKKAEVYYEVLKRIKNNIKGGANQIKQAAKQGMVSEIPDDGEGGSDSDTHDGSKLQENAKAAAKGKGTPNWQDEFESTQGGGKSEHTEEGKDAEEEMKDIMKGTGQSNDGTHSNPQQIKRDANMMTNQVDINEFRLNVPAHRYLSSSLPSAGYATGMTDYSYERPDYRFQDSEFIMPSMTGGAPQLCMIVDVSGSMSEFEIACCMKVCDEICDEVGEIDFMVASDRPEDLGTFHSLSELAIPTGGGTRMDLAFQYAMKKDKRYDVIFVLSDGDTPFGDQDKYGENVFFLITKKEYVSWIPEWIKFAELF